MICRTRSLEMSFGHHFDLPSSTATSAAEVGKPCNTTAALQLSKLNFIDGYLR